MADQRGRAGRNAGWLLLDQAFNSISNGLLVVLIARVAPADDLGRFSILLGFWLFLISSSRAVLGQPLLILRRTEGDDLRAGMESVALLYLTIMASVSAVGLALGGLEDVTWLPVLFPVATGLALLQDATRFGAFAAELPARALRSDTAWLISQIVVLALALPNGLTVDEIVFAWGFGALIGVVFAPKLAVLGPGRSAARLAFARLWHIGRYLGIGATAAMFTTALWPVVLASAGSLAIAGAFRVIDTVVQPVRVVGLAIETDLLSAGYARRLRVFVATVTGVAAVSAAIVAVAPWLSDLVFNSDIVADRTILAGAFVGIFMNTLALWPRAELKTTGREQIFAVIRITSSVAYLVALAVGAAVAGLGGAVTGFAVTSGVEALVTWAAARRGRLRAPDGAPVGFVHRGG